MKKAIIKAFQENIGEKIKNSQLSFSAWLAPSLHKINDQGDIELAFDIRPEMLNPYGTVHGGALSAILDETMGMQLFLKTAEEEMFLAMNLTLDFVKGAKAGERILAIPTLVRRGRRTANLRCVLKNEEGKLIAHGSSNFLKVNPN